MGDGEARPESTPDGVPLIDRVAHQCQLLVAGALNLAGAITGWWWVLAVGAAIFAVSCIDFPRTSPVVRLWNTVAPSVRPTRLLVDARPARVMAATTVPVMAVGGALLTTAWSGPTRIVLAGFGIGLLVEAVIGRCVTCESYRWLARRGIVHPDPPLSDACIIVPVR